MNNRPLLSCLISPTSICVLLLAACPVFADPPSILDVLGDGQNRSDEEAQDVVEDADEEDMDSEELDAEDEDEQPGSIIIQSVLDGGSPLLDNGRHFSSHDVELSAGVEYVINLTSGDFDTQIFLFDSESNQLAVNDDGPEMGTNSQIIFTPDADGTYSLGVSTIKAGKTGQYEITVNVAGNAPAPGPGADQDEVTIEPPTVLLTTETTLKIEEAYFSNDVELTVGQRIVVETYCAEGCDTIIELRRSTDADQVGENDEVVETNDDDTGRFGSRIVWTCDEAGAYYVGVGGYEDNVGDFKLIIREAVTEFREGFTYPNNEIPKEGEVYLGDFQLFAGENFTIETTNLSDGVDTVIELRRSTDPTQASEDDPILAVNDDFLNDNFASLATWTVDETGDYYLVIHNIAKTDGTCDVVVGFRE